MLVACDESIKGDYLFLGTIWVPRTISPELSSLTEEVRITHKLWGEVKWSHLTEKYLEAYKAFLSPFFDNKGVYFHAIAVPVNQPWFSIKTFFGSDISRMRERFLSLLLTKRTSEWLALNPECTFSYLIDENLLRNTGEEEWPTTLRGDLVDREIPVDIITSCSSHISSNLQACDLVIGAISSKWSKEKSSLNNHQADFVDFIEKECNSKLDDFDIWSPGFSKKISIWRWSPYPSF